ncbi:MAG: DUF2225 domain-containing protein [Ruminococcaceae bacterium]|nr:DUF2225 domain-containing protein [Oscillospiraceae bacterium]
MIQDETVKQLLAISEPKDFAQNEYICYEGHPGHEMYIVLKGSVGVYINSAIGTMTEICRIRPGDFFGEMSIFDDLPRSASCIALEDTICVSVNKHNLTRFFEKCPDVAAKLLENMSGRIRHLDHELYKTERFVNNQHKPEFKIPEEYRFSHVVEKPPIALASTQNQTAACPICGEKINVLYLRRNIMHVRKTDADLRVHYAECQPLWHEIINCPHCNYSNHYLYFFRIMPFNVEEIKQILKEQHYPVFEEKKELCTAFDHLVLRYLQAIHINETINAADNVLIGTLWLDLYWLACDVGDEEFATFCAHNFTEKLKKAIDCNEISDKTVKYNLVFTLAYILMRTGRFDEAVKYCDIATTCKDHVIKLQAYKLKETLDANKK